MSNFESRMHSKRFTLTSVFLSLFIMVAALASLALADAPAAGALEPGLTADTSFDNCYTVADIAPVPDDSLAASGNDGIRWWIWAMIAGMVVVVIILIAFVISTFMPKGGSRKKKKKHPEEKHEGGEESDVDFSKEEKKEEEKVGQGL